LRLSEDEAFDAPTLASLPVGAFALTKPRALLLGFYHSPHKRLN
jgi:hypothetical protein